MTMDLREVKMLLGLAAGFDNRKPDELTAAAWYEVLRIFDYEDAKQVIIAHATDSSEYLNVRHIVDGVKRMNRLLPSQIAADVRAARGYGFIGRDWPESEPITEDVMRRLTDRRAGINQLAIDMEDASVQGEPIDLGVTLKSPDDIPPVDGE